MQDIIIEAHGLKRYYRRGSETVKALDGVDISIRAGEIVSILGPSGSGKTTLINLLSCLDAPTEGTLMVGGKSVAGLAEDELVEVRRGFLGFVFQQFSLLPTLTVTENVELPLMFLGGASNPRRTPRDPRARRTRRPRRPLARASFPAARCSVSRSPAPDRRSEDPGRRRTDRQSRQGHRRIDHRAVQDASPPEKGLAILLTTHNAAFGYEADRVITLQDGKIVKEECGATPYFTDSAVHPRSSTATRLIDAASGV